MEVQRICQHCGTEFTAKTSVTNYCGNKCGKRAYKARIRNAKIERSNTETLAIKNKPIEDLKGKEFLTVTQVSTLLGCSRRNVYKMINTGKLKATNILEKKTIVKRCDIDQLFETPTEQPDTTNQALEQLRRELNELKQIHQDILFDATQYYNIKEVIEKYGIAEATVHTLIKKHNIPKIKKGWYSYVPQIAIDKLLSKTPK